jgi:membrane protein
VHPVSRWLIDRSPGPARPAVNLTVRTADAAVADRLPGLAAELAFWVLLSLPALLLTIIAALGGVSQFLDGDWQDDFIDRAADVSSVALTPATIDRVVVPILEQLLEGGGVGLVSIAFVATVWTASRAIKVVLVTLALVYGRHDDRPGWQARLLGFGLTAAAILIGAILAPLLITGPDVVAWLDGLLDDVDLSGLDTIWRTVYWPVIVILATLAIAALYHVGMPGRPVRWRSELPGAVLATCVWLAGSAGLRLYGLWIAGTGSVYGPLSGPIVVLLWIWLTGFAVLLGAELNAQRHRIRQEAATEQEAATGPEADTSPQASDATDPAERTEPTSAPEGSDGSAGTWPLSSRPPR